MKTLGRVLLALLLCLPLSLPAFAAGYSDLSTTHWAYDSLMEATTLGIISGMPGGTMQPSQALTWGQYLTMLGRAYYPDVCQAHTGAEGHWAMASYLGGHEAGVLHSDDFLPVGADSLDAPLLRKDAAVLLARLLPEGEIAADAPDFLDWDSLSSAHQPGVSAACAAGLISGMPDGTFQGDSPLLRAQGAVLLLRLNDLREGADPDAPTEAPEEIPAPEPPEEVPQSEPPAEEEPSWRLRGENNGKYLRLFGSGKQRRFSSEAEAEAVMTQVEVPVWRLDTSTGAKRADSCTFTVHEALAEDMVAIFTAIYEDPEQFPIKNLGGFRWSEGGKGEHNCGTAVDINWEENYQIYDSGQVGAGSYWLPGEDPFSLPAEGSVVRIFAQYGYSWGGNAWPGSRDYMHFSYMGK